MNTIAFFDTEIEPKSRKVLDIGCLKNDGSQFHKASLPDFLAFVKSADFIAGHNILAHDLKYIGTALATVGIPLENAIDTLLLSPLLFPNKPYHALIKDDKLQQQDGANNPLNDSINAKVVFDDEVAKFNQLDGPLQQIFYSLLGGQSGFGAFFRYLGYTNPAAEVASLIVQYFQQKICSNAPIVALAAAQPVELAYCLSLVQATKPYSITPPWVLKNYPKVDNILHQLRSQPCLSGCTYCDAALDVRKGLKHYFGFDAFRSYGGQPLQEQAAQAAIDNHSLLAVFPTGGGKSITFQVPALMSGENTKGLTVVISPLQSLMKDQVDNLEKAGITDAVTINGLLDPIERAKSLKRVEDGRARMLYISPESLRSPSIARLLLGRKIVRFVIDEAHCFSAWGQDFRVDYLYIGDFIQWLQQKKQLQEPIPVSCFTATAKQRVIADIQQYFKDKLSLDLRLFTAKAARSNLHYQVFEKDDEEAKYQAARNLIEAHPCPTIIYVSRTKTTLALAERLTKDGFEARAFNGKMDVEVKTANQNAFMSGEVPIIVATSAFGMGVDKKDVGMVLHYEISDSLENYVQEAGRAGRDEQMKADCFVLFNEEDLSKHFILLNQTKLSIKEIQQVWKAVKDSTSKFRSKISSSALEIARRAGWDENIREIETRVTTAIAALEDAGYLKRGQNMPRVYANSILSKTADEAIAQIVASQKITAAQQDNAIRIIKKLFASKRRKQAMEETAEARVDYIGDHLGIVKEEVLNIINLLREEKILADTKDLTAFIKKGDSSNRSLAVVESFGKMERLLLSFLDDGEKTLSLKELNEAAIANGCPDSNVAKLKTIFNFWTIKQWVKRQSLGYTRSHVQVQRLIKQNDLQQRVDKRLELAGFITQLLYDKSRSQPLTTTAGKEEVLVEFSVHELKAAYANSPSLFKQAVDLDDIEDTLFYLSRIGAIVIEGGFMVVYNRLTLERLEQDNYKRYTKDDYSKLHQFYESKVQQIHIIGEYARKMATDYQSALQFVEDYFQMEYPFFLRKYFPGSKANELKLKMTPSKFKQLFGELSPTQLKIIHDKEAPYIAVVAGPGSGKTRVLVHKLASLLLMEDVKHEQLLMITFSRAAVNEFKKRLVGLIGSAANYVEIKTFHAYCFDLLGQKGSLEKSEGVIKLATEKIRNKEVEVSRITKMVLVIDEAQDMNLAEFDLIKALMEQNEEMRVIAVGDDDQNIYEFRGSDSKYLAQFITENKAIQYELVENYRSRHNLVEFANQWANQIGHRLKTTPIVAHQSANGAIKLVHYQHQHLIAPLVAHLIAQPPSGSTCILTTTNDEAAYTTGLLLKNGLKAKLIQSNEGFDLYDLVELRFFVDCLKGTDAKAIIDDEHWDTAKQQLEQQFRNSKLLGLCQQVIKEFEASHPKKKYQTDLTVFLHEAKMEDFYDEAREMVFVSTIHKAKGKEFDNVYLLLDHFVPDTDEKKRHLYVGITRAKQNLNIHYNGNYLEHLSAENLSKVEDKGIYTLPNEITEHLTLRDVWLSYHNNQAVVAKLVSGDELLVDTEGCSTMQGQSLLKFSNGFRAVIATKQEKGYSLKSAKVNFVVYWTSQETGKEVRIVLPGLVFERKE